LPSLEPNFTHVEMWSYSFLYDQFNSDFNSDALLYCNLAFISRICEIFHTKPVIIGVAGQVQRYRCPMARIPNKIVQFAGLTCCITAVTCVVRQKRTSDISLPDNKTKKFAGDGFNSLHTQPL